MNARLGEEGVRGRPLMKWVNKVDEYWSMGEWTGEEMEHVGKQVPEQKVPVRGLLLRLQ